MVEKGITLFGREIISIFGYYPDFLMTSKFGEIAICDS
jgi:hypothetical protein